MQFYGRTREIELLNQSYRAPQAQLIVVYGRRRVGKTALLTHWASQQPEVQPLYWFADMGESSDQLRQFSQTLFEAIQGGAPSSPEYSYASWDDAFLALANHAQNQPSGKKLVMIIDEFTYLLAANPALSSKLQRAWDLHLKQSNILLILSGSYMGMMHDHVLAPQAPLYGRAQHAICLQPLPFGQTADFFPGWDAERRVTLYNIWGGVPGYWERLNPALTLRDNLLSTLLTPNSPMHSEPRLLLYDHISEPGRYISILRAISMGYRTPSEIGKVSGITYTSLPPYLQKLEEIGVIEHLRSLSAAPRSRSGRYAIRDPYLRFYYRFLERHIRQIMLGENQQVLAEIESHQADFVGNHTWEELCREWTLRAGARGKLPVFPDEVGSAWNKTAQIDLYAVNSMEKTLILGECKWTRLPESIPTLEKLISQAEKIIPDPKGATWQVLFLGFSRLGWTQPALRFAQENTPHNTFGGKHWECIGIQLLSLEDLDQDLRAWV